MTLEHSKRATVPLFLTQIHSPWSFTASWSSLLAQQSKMTNSYIPLLAALTPNSGAYMNEVRLFPPPNFLAYTLNLPNFHHLNPQLTEPSYQNEQLINSRPTGRPFRSLVPAHFLRRKLPPSQEREGEVRSGRCILRGNCGRGG